jgi:MoaA/NifB/PqqE/SkfB family radical SAM enzyme
MAGNGSTSKTMQYMVRRLSTSSTPQLVRLVKNPLVQKVIVREVKKKLLASLQDPHADSGYLPSVKEDRVAMAIAIMESLRRAIRGRHMSDTYLRGMLQILIKTLFIDRGNPEQRKQFQEAFGKQSPSFLLIAPGKACNLHCPGCYSDSDNQTNKLEWSLVDRVMEEAKALWGERFFVISGGEPFAYKSEGKGLVELFEKHQDSFFMVYTNGTLIDDRVSQRLSKAGNALLCLSIEGFKERTDARRGAGVFDRIMATMNRLNQNRVPFGVSLTATCENVEEILSEEFVDFIMKKGAQLAFIFHYMPIGRSFDLALMPTPEQRAWMWERSWEIVREKKFFMPDFWNHGTCVDGCIAAGGHGQGGYFYIDWNGAVTPCVFMPYSPLNIRDVYAKGKTLNDVWQHPFFQAVRQWEYDYVDDGRSMIAPCPNRDHHDELECLLMRYEPEPTDANAAETLIDPDYTRGLVAYNRRFQALTDPIWESRYLSGRTRSASDREKAATVLDTVRE